MEVPKYVIEDICKDCNMYNKEHSKDRTKPICRSNPRECSDLYNGMAKYKTEKFYYKQMQK